MLLTIAYYPGDRDQAVRLADWMNELGSYPNHEMFILRDSRCPPIPQLGESFGKKTEMLAHGQIDGWPQGANYFFRTITAVLANQPNAPRYFLWMEPDAIPLTHDWLDKIEAEFLSCKKPFMGDRVEVENVPLHMSGVGVYPNPLHAWAGEAYRAADEAMDMAGRGQIVPQAHFTKLIEHAWKHPTFTDPNELTTQIRPEAVLFHASKDGSLITLLRDKKNLSAVPVLTEPQRKGENLSLITDRSGEARESIETDNAVTSKGSDSRGGAQSTCDIFIRTYEKDYGWLKYCLKSIHKFCTGFRKIWIVSPTEDPASAFFDPAHIEWKVLNEESEDGYLSQQIHKLYADVITDYEADHILFMDSDTLFTQPVTPQTFFKDDKIVWYYTPYDHTDTPWKPITEKFMGKEVPYEFMRRHPFVVPRWLFPRFREFCHATHGLILSEYIKIQPNRSFSEFNALGAFAYLKYRDKFAWVNTVEENPPPPVVRQFFSWDGITPESEAEIKQILSGDSNVGQPSNAERGEKKSEMGTDQRTNPPPAQTLLGTGTVDSVSIPGPTITSSVPSQVTMENNGDSPGDHIRWLRDYVQEKPTRRQYVLLQLKKAGLQPKWKVKK